MGAKCCILVKDDVPMIIREKYRVPHELSARRNTRCSPSWSFRCDNRTHTEDTVDNPGCSPPNHSSLESKSGGDREIEGLPENSSPSESFQNLKCLYSSDKLSTLANSEACATDQSIQSHSPISTAPLDPSSSVTSLKEPEFFPDELSDGRNTNLDSLIEECRPHEFDRRISDLESVIKECMQHELDRWVSDLESLNEEGRHAFILSVSNNDLAIGESQGFPDGCSLSVCHSQRKVRLFDSQLSPFSFSYDSQTCGVCLKLLHDSVVAVLACGHVYHDECLECVTPKASKFDPSCPICSTRKNSTPTFLAKVGSKLKHKVFRKVTCGTSFNRNFALVHQKSRSFIWKDLKLGGNSWKSSRVRKFLKRHFSIASRPIRSVSLEHGSSRNERLWATYH